MENLGIGKGYVNPAILEHGGVGQVSYGRDGALLVKMYKRKIPNPFLSKQKGIPVEDSVDYIEIRIAGDKLTEVNRALTEEDKIKYKDIYARYISEQTPNQVVGSGMPLSSWPVLSEEQRIEYKYKGFHFVEQIAEASDAQIEALGLGAREKREQAIAFLAVAKKAADYVEDKKELNQLRQELKELKDALQNGEYVRLKDIAGEGTSAKVEEEKPIAKRNPRKNKEVIIETENIEG